MKVMLINGSPHARGCTYTALREAADALERNGVETEWMHVGGAPVAGCIACSRCRTTGECFVKDKVNELLEKLPEIDGLLVGSPVYYAGAAGQLIAFLDRAFYAGAGRFDGKPAAAVVSCRRGGATAAFEQINKFFSMNNMPIVTSQYWNQVHGFTPDDVRQDLEGLQTMRTLGNNMAWLLQCIEAGRKAGIGKPAREPFQMMNFIR